MNSERTRTSECMTQESPLVAFYRWLLTEERELNNILSLFEYRNNNLYLKRKKESAPEETLEMIFHKFQQGRSDEKYMSIQGQAIILGVFWQIFRDYYNTTSFIDPGEEIAQEIAEVVPFVRECLQKLITEELGKQKKDIPFEHVSKSVNNITGTTTS